MKTFVADVSLSLRKQWLKEVKKKTYN